jgi:hypothetical protein
MTGNPFWETAEDELVNERVLVRADQGSFRGVLAYFNYKDDEVLLRDVTTPTGERVPTALVDGFESVEHDPDALSRTVTTVDVEDIAPQPYTVREYDTTDFATFVRQLRKQGRVHSLPLVRPLGDDADADWQIVSGHRRVAAIREGGVERHPVEVEELDAWEATVRFVEAHFPIAQHERDDCTSKYSEWYAPAQMQAAFELLSEEWDRERLLELPAIATNEAILVAEDPERAHDVLAGDLTTAEPSEDAAEALEYDDEVVEDTVSTLAAETVIDEPRVRNDLLLLLEDSVPLETAEEGLRRRLNAL